MLKSVSKKQASLGLKGAILILGFLGQVLTLARSNFMSGEHFLYYTNISNILAMVLTAALFIKEAKALMSGADAEIPPFLEKLRFALAAGILLTFAGFVLLLAPQMSKRYLLSVDNLLVHFLVPLLFFVDFVMFSSFPTARLRLPLGLLLPLAYLLLVLLLFAIGHRFYNGVAPYFFLDYEKNGWFTAGEGKLGVFWWCLILLLLQLFISRLLLGLRKIRENMV